MADFDPKKGIIVQGLLCAIMSLLLAIHSVIGCCWHHAHQCPDAYGKSDHTIAALEGHCNHHQDQDSANHASFVDHAATDQCQSPNCVYVKQTQNDGRAISATSGQLFASILFLPETVGSQTLPTTLPCDLLAQSLRVHLVHQVLLI